VSPRPSSAFELYHPGVQKWIWTQGWTELRDIQEQAAREILSGEADVVIASATASGKTEAAFLPIGSIVAEEGRSALVTLYISPLKALINDQHRRLEEFFGALEIPVHRWHGDVAASAKQKVVRNPSGVLLITPESLEALFIRQGSRVPGIFSGLRHIVVDELHAFIGAERGRQLQSLMHRVELACRRRVPRVALSATLGDMDLACEFLRPGDGANVRRVVSLASRQDVRLQIRAYRETPPQLTDKQAAREEAEGREVGLEQLTTGDALDISRDLFDKLRGGRHIVFANRRAQVETYTDLLRRLAERANVPNEFWPHHGSLDKALRDEAEDALRAASRPATVLATTTLELGIDVGSVESIAQIGPPPSVASMRQRVGRSGRRGSAAVLRVYVQEPEITGNTPPHDQLRENLVQSIAMVRLLAERWYEPPTAGSLHLSTLVQQTLSLIAQHGGARADQMWSALCRTGPFADVDAAMFARFLRDLSGHGLISQTHDGEIVLDLGGERLVNHYDFFSAFATTDEYRLVSGARTLGTIPVTYPLVLDMHILFGGRRWRITGVDVERKIVELAPAGGGRAPNFGGSPALVHDRVRKEMREVLASEDRPPFVDATGLELLTEARTTYRRLELDRNGLVPWGRGTLIFAWAGDRAMHTIVLELLRRGLPASAEGIAIAIDSMSSADVAVHLRDLVAAGPADAYSLAASVENKSGAKHHVFLGEELLAADYASSHLDTMGAHRVLESTVANLLKANT
jgi:ATP-dependent Lhr-like helicase